MKGKEKSATIVEAMICHFYSHPPQ